MRIGMSLLDLKLGVRMLVKYPGLTLVGSLAISVAIAIGAAYFEFVNDFVHPKLPLEEGDRVVAIQSWNAAASSPEHRVLHDFVTWREESRTVREIGAFATVQRNLVTSDGLAEPVAVAEISASAFRLVRVPPLMGRPLVEADEHEGAPPVVVIGHGVWKARFGGDPAILGRTIQLGSTRSTVVGVMPEGFAFPVQHGMWTPLRLDAAAYERLQGPPIRVFGRLAPGATLREARAELAAIGARAAADHPRTHEHLRPRVLPYAESFFLSDATLWQVYLLNGVFVMLLVVACANVATLVFARTATREREIVVRNALGASRGRIVTQLFAEALVLSAVAAALGLAAAAWGMESGMDLFWAASGGPGPFWWNDDLAPATILYAGVFTVIGAVIVGVAPALKVTGRRLQPGLQRLAAGSGMRFGGMWTAVIVIQVALSVAFLPAAVSMGRAVLSDQATAFGVDADEYLTVRFALDAETPTKAATATHEERFQARVAALHEEVRRRLGEERGLSGVAFGSRLPGMEHPTVYVQVDGASGPLSTDPHDRVRTATVDPGFFDALRAPILAGRAFHSGDLAPGAHPAIVNRSFVRRHLGGENAVGRRVRYAARAGEEPGPWHEIVGVVADLGINAFEPEESEGLYLPAAPGKLNPVYLAVRVGRSPESFAPRLRAIFTAVDPTVRLYDLRPLDEVGEAEQRSMKALAAVFALLSLVALTLSTVGIYALMSFTVAQRTREIGIRAALGASPRRIVTAIFSRAIAQLALGVALGGAAAVLVGDQVAEEGPWLLLAIAALMMVVGILACVVPARRGLRIQPTEALRAGT
ncbi:MAG TPA: ABC transporter permease [Longimicrobium sp.]|nr:ABC transporter permease [Longimicrobium sp.]